MVSPVHNSYDRQTSEFVFQSWSFQITLWIINYGELEFQTDFKVELLPSSECDFYIPCSIANTSWYRYGVSKKLAQHENLTVRPSLISVDET